MDQDHESARAMFQRALEKGDSEAGVQLEMLAFTALAAPAVEVEEDEEQGGPEDRQDDQDLEFDDDEEDYEEEIWTK